MDDEDFPLELGADFLEMGAYVVAVCGVVHHDEEHGFFAKLVVVFTAFAPFLDAETEVIVPFFVKFEGFVLAELCTAGGVREDGVFDDVLMDGLDEGVVGDGLDEDGAVVVAGGGGDIDLEGEAAVALEHLVVDVLDGFEPSHAWIVDVVGLVVEDG